MNYHQTILSSKAFYSNMLDDWCSYYYSQNYNRYSYAWNNPLKYIDPSGYNNIRLDENTTSVPYIAGSSGYLNNWNYITSGIGPGSGNHWSDQYRGQGGNFMLGNQSSFDGMYGQGAWNNFYTSMFTKQATNGRVNSTMINDRTSISMVVGWMSAGFNISVVNAFGNIVLVGSFGALGTMRYGEGGGLIFSNKTAGMVKGEGVVLGAAGGGGKLWGISFDLLVSAGIPNMKNGFSLVFMQGNNDFGLSFTLYGMGDGYEAAASLNYLDIYSTNGKDMKIKDTYGTGQTWSYGLLVGNYSKSGNGHSNTLTPSSYVIDAYGISYGAPVSFSHYYTYTWGITWSQIIDYFYK